MAFNKKRINVRFDLANGQFEGGGNTYLASGLRISANILDLGAPGNSQAQLAIYGLPLSVMNQLSTVGTQINKMYKNGVAVEAGDDEQGMTLVFHGVIVTAFVNAQSMPQVCFYVMAMPQAFYAVKPVEPTSIDGAADAPQLMQEFAGQMEVAFENFGVKAKLASPYLPGTTWSKALSVARAGGFDMIMARKKLSIADPASTRPGSILISPQTGMRGYPAFNQAAVLVEALFNPVVEYMSEIEVRSDLTPANGSWKVNRLELNLESETPQGKWFMLMEAVPLLPTVS